MLGHNKQWKFLENSYKTGHISHAYLFHGPSRIGKKFCAQEFIKFLNCQNSARKPCGNCRTCADIAKGIFPDLTLIEPEAKEIKIAQMRELEYYFSLSPSCSLFKAAIIDQAHSMTQEAQNSFLKTLEEPKGRALFILITEYPERILPTILSRVQKIKFFAVDKSEIRAYLEKRDIPQSKIQKIIDYSLGRPGLAISFLEDENKLAEIDEKIKDFDKLRSSDLITRFKYVQELSKLEPQEIKRILSAWSRYVRNMMIEKAKYQNLDSSKLNSKSRTPKDYSLEKLKNIVEAISNIQYSFATTNINTRLALETLMLEL